MKMIPDELVQETWREVGSSSPAQVRALGNRLGKLQNNLLAFVMVFTQDLAPDARELAIYLLAVIFRIFEKASRGKIKRLEEEEIEAAYNRTEQFLERHIGAHERFLEKAARSLSLAQPFVMKYLLEALLEPPEENEQKPDLTDEESGQIIMILITAIDLLDKAALPEES